MTKRVLVAFDVSDSQARDVADLLASVSARLDGEAGYLDDGSPVEPISGTLHVALLNDDRPITPELLIGIYNVGSGS